MKYFLHDTSAFDDEKISELFISFGYEGLGLFYTLLEKIAKQEKPIKTIVLKRQLKVGKRLEKCWSFMEQIGIISSNNGETFNKQLLNYAESYQIKKEKTAEKVREWRENQKNKEKVTDYEPISNHSKVKVSKVKVSKVNVNTTISVGDADLLHSEFIKIYSEWYLKKVGVKYKFQGGEDGAAIKSIKNYIIQSIKDKTGNYPEDLDVTNGWQFILNNWEKWNAFYQQQLKISQINSNLPNIMANIRGFNGKQYKPSAAQTIATISEIVRSADGSI